MGTLVITVAVLAAETPKQAVPGAEAKPKEPKVEKKAEPKAAVGKKPAVPAPPKKARPKPALPPREKAYFYSATGGVSFPFAGGLTERPTKLRFDWPAGTWGIECGMDMPSSEVRLSYDWRRYNVDLVGGKWTCDQLLLCGGWRAPFAEVYEFIIGAGAGIVWNSADRAFDEPIIQDSRDFAWRLYSCIRYKPDLPVEFELWGRLTFAEADYMTFGDEGTQNLCAGEFGLAILGRF